MNSFPKQDQRVVLQPSARHMQGRFAALLEKHHRCHLHGAAEMPRVCEAAIKATEVNKIEDSSDLFTRGTF